MTQYTMPTGVRVRSLTPEELQVVEESLASTKDGQEGLAWSKDRGVWPVCHVEPNPLTGAPLIFWVHKSVLTPCDPPTPQKAP